MKIMMAATLFALASLPLLAQQVPMDHPSNVPGSNVPGAQQNAPQENSPAAQPTSPTANAETSATAETSAAPQLPGAEMRPVSAKLVSKLDSKTAKSGDDIVVETGAAVKIADGTEIPKGSKLEGHVLAVRPSGGQNSQVVLQFDQAELKGGQKLPIRTEIQSIAPPTGEASSSGADPNPSGAMNGATAENAPAPATVATPGGAMASGGSRGTGAPGAAPETGAATNGVAAAPTAGTIVSRDGKIAIRTTSVPGVLLANNAPGERDPRMAQAAGILVGAKRDIQLDGGTQMVIGIASGGANPQ